MGNKITGIVNHLWESELEVGNILELGQIAITRDWSHAVFKNKERKREAFLYTNYIVIDIDEGMTLEEARAKIVALNYTCVIVLSRNHKKEKNGINCDRFRIIFELDYPITSDGQFKATVVSFLQHFPSMDQTASTNAAGQWFKGQSIDRVIQGVKIMPVAYERPSDSKPQQIQVLPKSPQAPSKATIKFISTVHELDGKRWEPFRRAVIDLKQQGFTEEQARNFLTSIHSDWFTDEYEQKLYGIYNNVEPKYPARITDGSVKSPTQEFIYNFLLENSIAVSFSRVMSMGSSITTRGDVLRKMRIKRLEEGLIKTHRDSDMEDILDEWVEKTRLNHITAVKDGLKGKNEQGMNELKKFMMAITGKNDPVEETVMLHWLWQVKRKIMGLEVTDHIMPVLVGNQGSGKTYAITKILFKPLKELATKSNFKTLTDPREGKLIMEHFAIFLDELSGSEKAEVNEIKRILTSDVLKIRVMRETHHETGVVTASFIGASNSPVKEMIKDETGMRRFFEIETLPAVDRALINSVDPDLLWKAIDFNDPAPYNSQETAIRARQEELRHKGPVEEWVIDTGEVLFSPSGEFPTTVNDLRDAFVRWYGQSYTMNSFGRALKKIGGVDAKRFNSGYRYNLVLNKRGSEGNDF